MASARRTWRWPRATAPARLRLLGYRRPRPLLPVRRAAVRRRCPAGSAATGSTGTPGGRCFARRRSSTPRRYYPVRVTRYVPVATPAAPACTAAVPASRRLRVLLRRRRVHRSTTTARRQPVGRRPAAGPAAAAQAADQADGRECQLPSKVDALPVEPGDRFVFRTAGAGGRGDPLERPAEFVRRTCARDRSRRSADATTGWWSTPAARSTTSRPRLCVPGCGSGAAAGAVRLRRPARAPGALRRFRRGLTCGIVGGL